MRRSELQEIADQMTDVFETCERRYSGRFLTDAESWKELQDIAGRLHAAAYDLTGAN